MAEKDLDRLEKGLSALEPDDDDGFDDTLQVVIQARERQESLNGSNKDHDQNDEDDDDLMKKKPEQPIPVHVPSSTSEKALEVTQNRLSTGVPVHEGGSETMSVEESLPGAYARAPPATADTSSTPSDDPHATSTAESSHLDLELPGRMTGVSETPTSTTAPTPTSAAEDHLHMLEAVPVTDEVVVAELATDRNGKEQDDDHRKLVRRLKILCPVVLLAFVALAIGMGVLAAKQSKHRSNSQSEEGSGHLPSNHNHNQAGPTENPQEPTNLTYHERPVTTSTPKPTNSNATTSPLPLPQPPSICFSNRSELIEAMDLLVDTDHPLIHNQLASTYGWPVNAWCVSYVQNFDKVFSRSRNARMETFSHDIGHWDMTNASGNLKELFRGVQTMSSHLGIQHWNTSAFTSLDSVFHSTRWIGGDGGDNSSLNDTVTPPVDLSGWDTSKVITLKELFRWSRNTSGVQGLEHWDTSRVTTMIYMASGAIDFNANISSWNTSNVRDLLHAFNNARIFDQDLSGWQTSQLRWARHAFENAVSFNSPLDSWDTSRLEDTRNMFRGATSFNQPLSSWNVSQLTQLQNMFRGASNFSQNLCAWGAQLPSTADVSGMFRGTNCPNTDDPILSSSSQIKGPFCFDCE